jgi:hypothetical protein
LAALHHPRIASAIDAGRWHDHLYLVMEYIPGKNLEARLAERRGLPIPEVIETARQIADGLAFAHELGLVHRDVKPSNLMRTPDGQIKILDLGIARLTGPYDEGGMLTQDGAVVGTPDYVSPEQIQGKERLDGKSDLYSLGCTLYHLLAGHPPFARYANVYDKFKAHVELHPRDLVSLRPDTPKGLADVVHRLLAKNPLDRYGSASELVRALDRLSAAGEGERGEASPRAVSRWPVRRAGWWAGAGVLGLIVLLVASWSAFGPPRSPTGSGRGANADGSPPPPVPELPVGGVLEMATVFVASRDEPNVVRPVPPNGDAWNEPAVDISADQVFKIQGRFFSQARWSLVWHDTRNTAETVARSDNPTLDWSYPPQDEFVAIHPEDPAGTHYLLLLTTDTARPSELDRQVSDAIASCLRDAPADDTQRLAHLRRELPAHFAGGMQLQCVLALRTNP